MEPQTTTSRMERVWHFVIGLTVILVSYSATLLAARFFITRV